jgi:hypothetical protein
MSFDSLAMETEQLGNATLGQMSRQREQLQNANSNVDATLEVVRQAGAVLMDMWVMSAVLESKRVVQTRIDWLASFSWYRSRRAFRNKLALYVMIGFLAMANVWALIHMFKKK